MNFKKLRIWSHLLKKSLMENLIFCAALPQNRSTMNAQDSAQEYNQDFIDFETTLIQKSFH